MHVELHDTIILLEKGTKWEGQGQEVQDKDQENLKTLLTLQ